MLEGAYPVDRVLALGTLVRTGVVGAVAPADAIMAVATATSPATRSESIFALRFIGRFLSQIAVTASGDNLGSPDRRAVNDLPPFGIDLVNSLWAWSSASAGRAAWPPPWRGGGSERRSRCSSRTPAPGG